MLVVDLFMVESFGLVLDVAEYFSADVSFDVEVVAVGFFFIIVLKVEGESLDVGVPLLR